MSNAEAMDLVETSRESKGQLTFGLSWVGYLAVVPTVMIHGMIIYFTATQLADMDFGSAIYAIYAFSLASVVYQILLARSVKLLVNDDGVWVIKGVLPWTRSCMGLQWRNVSIASYANNFFTWLLRTYQINIEDRFTGEIEMTVSNIRDGKVAVSEINRILAEKHAA